jgi:hypothetical protein
MLAALGDSIYKSMGVQSNALGAVQQGIEHTEDNDLIRQKLAAEVEARKAKLLEPPQFAQNAQWLLSQPKPVQDSILQAMDLMNPIAVSTPMGTQRVPRTFGGAPSTKTINGVTYYNIDGEWYDNPEGR